MVLKQCIYLLFCIIYLVSASGDPCETRDTCSKCITYPNCVWCARADFGKKCIKNSPDVWEKCKGNLQVKESKVEVTENKPYSASVEKVVQLTPQKIKIDLRVGQSTIFNFTYKQAENYPVDLYFLLDASSSMTKVRGALKTQSRKIYDVMHKFTTNIRLGLGTFVDKNAFPYSKNPGINDVYSFKHHLDLTENVTAFNDALSGINFVENFDSPEGGLDALAQVLACNEGDENIIQWNKHSRKFVLFITDELFHAAGDGLLAGIHQPYDGKCYTTKDGIYTKELEMDYPSVSMIYKLVKRIEAIPIFIVKEDKASIYSDLCYYLGGICKDYKEGGSDSGTHSFDDKLRDAYETQTQSIKLKTTIPGIINEENLKIHFTPDCSENNDDLEACKIQGSQEIKITGNMKLETYKTASEYFTVDIVVNGINEKLQLEVRVLTNCDCETEGSKNAPECSGNGTLVCGLCECNKNWYGSKCKCNKPDDDTDSSSCKMNKDDVKVCSGNGKCECGSCKCDSHGSEQTYSGTYCQCDAHSCPIGSNGKQCSGHGACGCGRCMCDKSWDGGACETSTLKTNCMKDNKECYGLGTCTNNTCKCDEIPEWDARQAFDAFCGIVAKTEQNQCKLLETHAGCAYEKKSSCPNKDTVNITLTKYISESEKKSMHICDDVRVGPGCYIQFGYRYNDGERTVQLLVEEKANCLESHYMYGGIILATLIIVGICTLVGWKILTTRRDRKEYEQFLISSNRQSSIRKNVLYTSPKTTVDNPTYENN